MKIMGNIIDKKEHLSMEIMKPMPRDERDLSEETTSLGLLGPNPSLEKPRAKLLMCIRSSMKIKRSFNHVLIVLVGTNGVGKSSTVNHLLGTEVAETNVFQSETRSTKEFTIFGDDPKYEVEGLSLGLIDTPGSCDADGSKQDACNLSSMQNFFNSHPKLSNCYPNLVLLVVKATDIRISELEKSLRCIKQLHLVDLNNPNVVVILSHACSIRKKSHEEWTKALNVIKSIVSKIVFDDLKVLAPVVLIENMYDDCNLEHRGDYTVLPNGEFQPRNLYEACANVLLINRDDLGLVTLNSIFGQSERKNNCRVYSGHKVKAKNAKECKLDGEERAMVDFLQLAAEGGFKDPFYSAVLQYISEQKLEGEEKQEVMKIAGILKHLGEGNPPNFDSHSVHSIEYFLGKEISPIGRQMLQEKFKIAVNPPSKHLESESTELWKWRKTSITHREKLEKLVEHAKKKPEEIQEINGVRVCFSKEFLIAPGSQGTRVYVGIGKDGVEKAVKRLPSDVCLNLAEQEKKVLNELNTVRSNHVVNYWFLDDQSNKEYLFLILDLCEETLENFVERSPMTDLERDAPGIIQQVLKGLADIHREPKPIIHRDLKPSNILKNVQGNWLLADFGISQILKSGVTTHLSVSRGTEDWKAVESCRTQDDKNDEKLGNVCYKKESDIQVAGMVSFYILTKSEHPFGERPNRLSNLLGGKPVGLDTLEDPAAKDLLTWMLSHDPSHRPSAEEALKHPYLQPAKEQFEMLCKVGNQREVKTHDIKSDVVRKLNSTCKNWKNRMEPNILRFLSTDCSKGKIFFYEPSTTGCLKFIRNVTQHWNDHPMPRPEEFYIVGNPQDYFLKLFHSLPVEVHRILRSCDWKERPDLKEYFI